MKKSISTSLLILAASTAASFAVVTVQVFPSLGPMATDAFLSPTLLGGYAGNAIAALEAGNSSAGPDRNVDPAGYSQTTIVSAPDIVYTDSPAWNGEFTANPAFANERNSSIYFGLHVQAMDETFEAYYIYGGTVQDQTGNDVNPAGYHFNAFSATRVGIYYGADGVKGGVDDVTYTSGTTEGVVLNEFNYVGLAMNFSSPNAPGFPATTQQDLDDAKLLYVNNLDPFETYTTTYDVYSSDLSVDLPIGSGTATVTVIPEASTSLLSGLALLGLALRRRRA